MMEESQAEVLAATFKDLVTRACSELPPGPAIDQLRNFCGRGWEVMHTPAYARMYRLMVAEVPRNAELARVYAESICAPVHRVLESIIERGIARSEFRPVNPRVAARVIVATLVQQAFWCNHAEAFEATLGNGCNRIVTDTLSIVLGGIAPA